MRHLILKLLASRVLVSSALCYLVVLQPTHIRAAEAGAASGFNACTRPTEVNSNLRMTCTRVNTKTGESLKEIIILPRSSQTSPQQDSQPLPDDVEAFEFTDEESNASVALFGCDCPVCLNALRQLRNMPPLG